MSRPRPPIQLSLLDHFLEGLSIAGILLTLLFPLLAYDSLPERIPSHINAAGEVDDYSNKASIWLFPVITVLLYLFLTIINKFPHHFNYTVKISEANAKRQYKASMRLIRTIKMICCLFFALISYQFVQLAQSGNTQMGSSSVFLFLLAIFTSIGYYFWEVNREV